MAGYGFTAAGDTARFQQTDWSYLNSYSDEQIAAIVNTHDRDSQRARAEWTAAISQAARRNIDALIVDSNARALITETRQSWADYGDADYE